MKKVNTQMLGYQKGDIMLWNDNKIEYVDGKFKPKNVDIEVDDFVSAEIIYDLVDEENDI